jgi:alpha,alpha-trehalose-phosphate synthase [UDP-forming]
MFSCIGKERGLIVVSNRLPFSRDVDEEGKFSWHKSAGGLITAFEPIIIQAEGTWLGWDGYYKEEKENEEVKLLCVKDLIPEARDQEEAYKIGCLPMSASEVEQYYNQVSNGTLWSLFHYFFEKCFLDYSTWEMYRQVNRRFANYIDKIASAEDIVWIQDYHLFLVPFYLRALRPLQQIHFFLHIPFPHIDIFSILPWHGQILESLLCCQTVGFHHKQYLKNFDEAIRRHTKKPKKEHFRTHFYANPISIDFGLIDQTSRKPEVAKRKDEIRDSLSCSKMILGVDRIDYSKGIKERLLALELLLQEQPELKESFLYHQLVIPSRESVESYQTLKKEIDEIVGRINGSCSTDFWAPVRYRYGTVSFEELVALYLAADIALVTPLRDGMNLVCKEYIAAHSDHDGVLILSKFAGAIAEIKDCIAVNPYSIEEIKQAIFQALFMPKEERKKRMNRMRKNIRSHDIKSWLENCLHHFELAHKLRR